MAPDLVTPAFLWVPEHHSSGAGEACDLAELAGFTMDAEQRLALDAVLAEDERGRPAAFESAVIAARQNMKTAALIVAALYDVFLLEVDLHVWTAHQFATAQEAFRDFDALIEGCSYLSRRVKSVSRANGEEGFETTSGSRLLFKARSKGGGRGFAGQRVTLDEAFALQSAHMGALMPLLSAQEAPALRYGSSAGLLSSDFLRTVRNRGRAGGDPSLAYVEWGDVAPPACAVEECDHLPAREGCCLDDRERWRRANPAMGRRIREDIIASERRSLPPMEFARERLGWWEDPVEGAESLWESWLACLDGTAAPVAPLVMVADATPGLLSASVVVCGAGSDERPVLEVVDARTGVTWLPERLAQLQADHDTGPMPIDPGAPIGALIPDLVAAGVELETITLRDVVQACGSMEQAVRDGAVLHRGQPELDGAVQGGRRRAVGDGGWKWSRVDSSVNITSLVAATVARHRWVALAGDNYDVTESVY